jgi:hypothetical protein
MKDILVPAERVKVVAEADVCVIGGSCTGVFAALRAARLGARVALIERQNRFGGVATCGLVGMWHTLHDYTRQRQIIGGLTFETMQRLARRNAVSPFLDSAVSIHGIRFNTEELTLELDALVNEQPRITTWLQTAYSRVIMNDDGAIDAVVIENKSGRFAIRAKVFVDASGDGVLCRDAGVAMTRPPHPQPPTACARFEHWDSLGPVDVKALCDEYRDRFPDLPCGYSWGMRTPASEVFMLAGTRVMKCDCSDADAVTQAEFESRRQIRAFMDMLRVARPGNTLTLQALPSAMGIREGRHITPLALLKGDDMLKGTRFPDAIGNGTYPVDIHHDEDDSISFKRLDGSFTTYAAHRPIKSERWLPEGEVLPFYQFTLGCLIPEHATNFICAGRMIGVDREAFGALRVMVNLNQCGEAAGVAAWQALTHNVPMTRVDAAETRALLTQGGSIII